MSRLAGRSGCALDNAGNVALAEVMADVSGNLGRAYAKSSGIKDRAPKLCPSALFRRVGALVRCCGLPQPRLDDCHLLLLTHDPNVRTMLRPTPRPLVASPYLSDSTSDIRSDGRSDLTSVLWTS
jgi:hypothetical protein